MRRHVKRELLKALKFLLFDKKIERFMDSLEYLKNAFKSYIISNRKTRNFKQGGKPVDRSGLYMHSKKKNKAVLDEVPLC